MALATARPRQGREVLPPRTHRKDIQGLRAVAVLLVAFNHAGLGFLDGGYVGVDVFFVLSGYLITGVLIGDAARNRRVSISEFYIRRARRILPAATLTLVATTIASYLILNVVRAKEAFTDITWSAFFGANVHFANVGTDYFAKDRPESPVRHFWSLAVEEQFYIVWPTVIAIVLFGLLVLPRHKDRRKPITERALRRLTVVIAVIFAVSLAWSVSRTHSDPTAAYFSTFTRAWELALGAGLATIMLQLHRLPRQVRLVLGWTGLAAIAAAATLFDAQTAFPGYAALLPCVGAAMVIAAGVAPDHSRFAAGRLLAIRPMRYTGDLSYTLYLWHWPILVLAEARHGSELSLQANLALLAGAFLLSVITYTYFENPLRRGRKPRQSREPDMQVLLAWIMCPLLVFLMTGIYGYKVDKKVEAANFAQYNFEARRAAAQKAAASKLTLEQRRSLDEAALRKQEVALNLTGALPAVTKAAQAAERGAKIPKFLTPSPATDDFANAVAKMSPGCSAEGTKTSSAICATGSGSKSMVVFGDSKAYMWLPAIEKFATRLGYRVLPVVKSECGATHWGGAPSTPSCRKWLGWAKSKVAELKPDVVLLATRYLASDAGSLAHSTEASKGITELIPELRKSAKKVILVGDIFGQHEEPGDCLLRDGATLGTCSTPYDAPRKNFYRTISVRAIERGAGFIDVSGWFCARATCPSVVGDTVVYAAFNHVTKAYADQLVDIFQKRFTQALTRTAAT
jgi:peptidoglycan/LPS O-acetylase OafA/YrhL